MKCEFVIHGVVVMPATVAAAAGVAVSFVYCLPYLILRCKCAENCKFNLLSKLSKHID